MTKTPKLKEIKKYLVKKCGAITNGLYFDFYSKFSIILYGKLTTKGEEITMTDIQAIILKIDNHLEITRRQSVSPVEGNVILDKAELLRDSKDRPGKPLRNLLRRGLLPHAYQTGGKGSEWIIPHSSKQQSIPSGCSVKKQINFKMTTQQPPCTIDITKLKSQIKQVRQKYKPDKVKILLIAEAPPDNIDRFFYYPTVKRADYLFLGVIQALYPDMKEKFLLSGRDPEIKKSILNKFKGDGFYLVDLSELPLSLMTGDLHLQTTELIRKVKEVADKQTKIILIKANVYEIVYSLLKQAGCKNIIDVKMPFPGQRWQREFQIKFKEALELASYR
ncbi:MAG: hypothetical protein KKB77_01645 [Bacteroidetes bacterium]|nr:hypothetical protein [Bacteroidota bacterium]